MIVTLRWAGLVLFASLIGASCGTVVQQNSGGAQYNVVPVGSLKSLKGEAVVSYNVENLFDTKDDPASNDEDFLPNGKLRWTEDRYRQKLVHLAEAITWAGDGPPAIVGLAEVENVTVLKDLVGTGPLKHAGYTIIHYDSPDERGIDVALLVRSAFANVLHAEPLHVDLGRDRTRDVLYAQLQLANSDTLHLFMAHWPSRGGGERESAPKRMAASRVVRDKLDGLFAVTPPAKVLIMGDFNDYPEDVSIRKGLGAACDLTTRADLFDLMCMDQPPNSGSYQYNGEWGWLDQMIVSRAMLNGPGITIGPASACRDERLFFKHPKYGLSPDKTYSGGHYKGGYSDHLPVVARWRN